LKKKSIVLMLLLTLLIGCGKNSPSEQLQEETAPVNAVVAETSAPEKSKETVPPEDAPVEPETEGDEELQPPTLSPEMLQGLQDDTEESWEYIPSTMKIVNDDGTIQLTFDGLCTLTLPKNWDEQFSVMAGEGKNSYIVCTKFGDNADIFSISGITPEELTGNERAILGTWSGGLVVLNCPENPPQDEAYQKLSADIGEIIQNAEGMTSTGFQPIDTTEEGNFVSPANLEVQDSELIRGTWAVNTSMWTPTSITQMEFGQNSVYVIFTVDGKCAYRFFPQQDEGYYLLNTSITSTDSYNEKPYALCYFNGQLHRVLIYQMAMQIEGMQNITKKANAFDGGEYVSNVWDFYQYSQSQSLSMDSMLDN